MYENEFRRDAIFSSGTDMYIHPFEPEPYSDVTIRCRTGLYGVDAVYMVHNDERFKMLPEERTDTFQYYAITIQMSTHSYAYHFMVVSGEQHIFFNKRGDSEIEIADYDYVIRPGFRTPNWAKGAVIYQIYTDRFCNGDETNDVLSGEYSYIGEHVNRVEDWSRPPLTMDVREFYGGDLQGILDKLDYLQDLGVEVIYLNPIFVSPSNHKYDTQDYDYIDPHFTVIKKDGGECLAEGDNDNSHASKYIERVVNKENLEASNEFFAEFMRKVHERGMRVILDGVFNHCGSFNKWLDKELIYANATGYEKGAFVSEDSPYHDFFKFYPEGSWPNNMAYDGWWGHDTLPKLNYENSEKLTDYILRIGQKWVSPPYNVDGWRLDVAADLGHSEEFNHKFWKKFRKAVKEANPDAIVLAEHYGNPSAWLAGDEWDTVMNYDAFMEPVSWFMTGMEKHSDVGRPDLKGNNNVFYANMTEYTARFSMSSLLVAMNELSNHDHSRFLTRTNGMVGRLVSMGTDTANMNLDYSLMRAAVLVQMSWPGAPTIYYGDEAGLCGWTDPDSRRTYPWGQENKELINFHKEAIRIHKDYKVFKDGTLIYLNNEQNLICFGRFSKDEYALCAVYMGEGEIEVNVPVWRMEAKEGDYMASMIYSDAYGFDIRARIYHIENGCIKINLKKHGAIIVKNVDRPY